VKQGEYVRTSDGEIHNCLSVYIDNNNPKLNRFMNQWGNVVMVDEITKTSKDIIDLIEVEDLMYIDISPDDYGGIVVPRIAETLNELEKYKKMLSNGCVLKGIVTHEQLQRECYWTED